MTTSSNYTHIFWDWNGTLLDDVDYCIRTVNLSLGKRDLPLLTKKRYWDIFRFPIVEYYKDLGFDFEKEPYEDLAEEYCSNYAANNGGLPLRKETKEVLSVFRSKNLPQIILSASERTVLVDALRMYGIDGYFSDILCTDNNLAEGKIAYGKRFAESLPENAKTLLIGDTEHDLETANAIGADCVLIKGGHSSDRKLESLGAKAVIGSLHELYPIVFGRGEKKRTLFTAPVGAAERRSFDLEEAEPKTFAVRYKAFYDDLKNTNKTEDW